ncbi:hypothetical protein BDM02DRAFT_3186102 [Thelephora ganbajun]|uniref:Uncharacterized protein n=1 Tax=Thelephora ganbajun TaxID=370292 RepID=A0ACB6ZJA3_THEGA|nr:hypothetical protein BDM02DRAFT_3186102 [Thelephora ganbajun]
MINCYRHLPRQSRPRLLLNLPHYSTAGTSFSPHPKDPNPPPSTSLPIPAQPLLQTAGNAKSVPLETGTPYYSSPPFDTHKFFVALLKSFEPSTARSLMRATRALLVDRIGRVRNEALSTKDLENQAYLFNAASSELRNEVTLRSRNEFASLHTVTSTIRREVDALGTQINEDVSNLKHEIQMELGNRKNEAKNELKRQDIVIESMYNRTMGSSGDLKTEVEEAKWDNMRKSVAALSCFLVLILVGLEFTAVARSKTQKAAEKAQPQSWDRVSNPPPQSQDPFEAADERN